MRKKSAGTNPFDTVGPGRTPEELAKLHRQRDRRCLEWLALRYGVSEKEVEDALEILRAKRWKKASANRGKGPAPRVTDGLTDDDLADISAHVFFADCTVAQAMRPVVDRITRMRGIGTPSGRRKITAAVRARFNQYIGRNSAKDAAKNRKSREETAKYRRDKRNAQAIS